MNEPDVYLEAWAAFRRYAFWTLSLMPTFVIVTFLVAVFNRELAASHLLIPGLVFVGAVFLAFNVANYKLRGVRCPKCRHLWMARTGLLSKCGVCGTVRGTRAP